MHFCENCGNMYYIKLNKEDGNNLVYYCRNCGNEKINLDKSNICVLDIDFKKSEKSYDTIINEYTKFDPTLPRIHHINCPNPECKTNHTNDANDANDLEISDTKKDIIYLRYDDENMKYLYICSTCNFVWKSNNIN